MRQTKEIRNFFYSQYFADGLRITMGCIIPLLVCMVLGQIQVGTLMTFGGLLIGLSDTPGAPHHRRAGMLTSLLLNVSTGLVILLINQSLVTTTMIIAILSFIYSMFAVFNTRAATVGLVATLTMLITVDVHLPIEEALQYLFFFMLGGAWYMLISMSLLQVKPYRLAQQELSESIRHVADFIRLKGNFYRKKVNLNDNYNKLIDQQITVHTHQENVRELLFQSKRSIKDTTKTGRYLSLIFTDIVDLFEQSMTTHYDYEKIRDTFGKYKILPEYAHFLVKFTNELDHIAYRLNADKPLYPLYNFDKDIERLKKKIDKVEAKHNINTITLKKILANIRTMVGLINNMYSYNLVNTQQIQRKEIKEASKFVNTKPFDFNKFIENLSLESSAFRHALRVSIVLSSTFIILRLTQHFGNVGVFWVLLTILVILRPGFGLTKERNIHRLIGTAVGGIMGALILMTIHDESIRFILLTFFFLAAYSLFRINYIASVLFMTPYVLILMSFTGIDSIAIAKERIIDTFLGGGIAFISSYIIFPNWESFQIKGNMRKLLISNYNYIAHALRILQGRKGTIMEIKLLRKEVYIQSANMGSTFQRILTEPRWRQRNTDKSQINSFVILNHMLSSYSATLITLDLYEKHSKLTEEQVRLLKLTLRNLEKAIILFPEEENDTFQPLQTDIACEYAERETEETRLITEQLQFLNKISSDLLKAVKSVLDDNTIEENENING